MRNLHVQHAPPESLLSVYLDDHLSGATAGHALAKRALLSNRGTPYEAGLRRLTREIEQELADLRTVISHRGGSSPIGQGVKVTAAVAGERLGRLKLNGQLRGYSPLSRVIELEGLTAGVQAKRSLWRNLQALEEQDALPAEVDLDHLAEQADDQLTRLVELLERAGVDAFRRRA